MGVGMAARRGYLGIGVRGDHWGLSSDCMVVQMMALLVEVLNRRSLMGHHSAAHSRVAYGMVLCSPVCRAVSLLSSGLFLSIRTGDVGPLGRSAESRSLCSRDSLS